MMTVGASTILGKDSEVRSYDPAFGRKGFARDLCTLRFRGLRMSQSKFASVFGLTMSAVKDQERARFNPSRAMKVLVAAIELDPELMRKAAALAQERWP